MFIEHKKRRFYYYFAIFNIVLFVVVYILMFLHKEKDFLELERRKATTIKNIKIDYKNNLGIENIEKYMKEQFPLRDELLKVKGFLSHALGINYDNGVYICSGNYIEEEIIPEGDLLYDSTMNLRKLFYNAKGQVDFFLFPSAYYINNDLLPDYARKSEYDTASYLLTNTYLDGKIHFHDMAEPIKNLKNKNIDIYYKTDHHMTTEAMYHLKPYILEKLGLADKINYIPHDVSDNFRGSLLSKSGIFLPTVKDNIKIYEPSENVRYIITDYQNNIKKSSVYDFDKLDSYDQYQVFMGGNSGHISIKTENYMKKKLLVVKDSYFNCFLPFLLSDFGEIDIIDPRYITKSIKDIVNINDYENIMIFYNYDTFITK